MIALYEKEAQKMEYSRALREQMEGNNSRKMHEVVNRKE